MPGPVRGNFQITNIIAGDKLRSGDFINARVKSVLPNGRFLLNWNGRVLTAKRARVERRSGGFFLHLVDSKKTAPPILNSQTATRTLLSAALLRAGLPLPNEAEAARRVALLNRTKGHRVRQARLCVDKICNDGVELIIHLAAEMIEDPVVGPPPRNPAIFGKNSQKTKMDPIHS